MLPDHHRPSAAAAAAATAAATATACIDGMEGLLFELSIGHPLARTAPSRALQVRGRRRG